MCGFLIYSAWCSLKFLHLWFEVFYYFWKIIDCSDFFCLIAFFSLPWDLDYLYCSIIFDDDDDDDVCVEVWMISIDWSSRYLSLCIVVSSELMSPSRGFFIFDYVFYFCHSHLTLSYSFHISVEIPHLFKLPIFSNWYFNLLVIVILKFLSDSSNTWVISLLLISLQWFPPLAFLSLAIFDWMPDRCVGEW